MKRSKKALRRLRRRKSLQNALVLVLALLVLTLSAGSTLAYIMEKTDGVENTFTPAQVTCEVQNNLSVKNTSNIKAYIRAMVVVNWVDKSTGGVYGIAPIYTATMADGWSQDSDTGIYYYNTPVDPSDTIPAPAAISGISENPNEDKYECIIEVVAEAIQAEGLNATSAQDAWVKAAG